MKDEGRPARNGHRHHQLPETVPVAAVGDGVPRLALSPAEAAAALGVSRDFLDEHIGPELRWLAESGARTLDAA